MHVFILLNPRTHVLLFCCELHVIPHVAACFPGTILYLIMPNSLATYFSMVAWCERTSDGQLYDVEREVLHVSAPLIHRT
jgi:hypothetical protein